MLTFFAIYFMLYQESECVGPAL